jgi:hypothetical protein
VKESDLRNIKVLFRVQINFQLLFISGGSASGDVSHRNFVATGKMEGILRILTSGEDVISYGIITKLPDLKVAVQNIVVNKK